MVDQREFRKKLLSLVLPIAFSQFMLSLVSACDALMLGRLRQSAMSAAALAGQVQFVLGLFTAALTIGASMFAAQYWGKGDRGAVEAVFALTLRAGIGTGLVFTLVCGIKPELFMNLLTDDLELRRLGAEYLRAVSPSYLLCAASQIYLCIMKNSGQTPLSTAISSGAVVLNILGNGVLIFGLMGFPALGIRGAAYATVLARAVELMASVWNSLRPGAIPLRFQKLVHPDEVLRRHVWKYTLPVLGNELVWGVGFTMSTVILGHMGADAVAANSVAGVVRNLLVCFCLGLSSGGGILVGNALGAGELEEAKRLGRRLTRLAALSGTATGLLVLALIPAVLHLTDLTPASQDYLRWMLVFSGVWTIGKSINCTTVGGIFCAGGDSRFGLLCDAVTLWCITVPLGLLAAFLWKLPVLAVYAIVNMDELIKLPAVYRHYRKYIWVKDLTRLEETT